MAICAVRMNGLHSCQPDGRQCCRNFFRIKLLIFLAAEKFLDQEMVNHHSQEPPRREQGINLAECALPGALRDVPGQRLVLHCRIIAEKTRGKRVVLKRREPQKPRKFSVARGAAKKLARNGSKYLGVITAALQDLMDALLPSSRRAQLFNQRAVKVFFAGKMAEQQRFIDACSLCDLPGRGALKSLPRKQACGYLHDLLAAVLG